MQATSNLRRSSSTRQPKGGPATTAARQLVLFSLPEPIGSCWDLICPEEAWEQPLRWVQLSDAEPGYGAPDSSRALAAA